MADVRNDVKNSTIRIGQQSLDGLIRAAGIGWEDPLGGILEDLESEDNTCSSIRVLLSSTQVFLDQLRGPFSRFVKTASKQKGPASAKKWDYGGPDGLEFIPEIRRSIEALEALLDEEPRRLKELRGLARFDVDVEAFGRRFIDPLPRKLPPEDVPKRPKEVQERKKPTGWIIPEHLAPKSMAPWAYESGYNKRRERERLLHKKRETEQKRKILAAMKLLKPIDRTVRLAEKAAREKAKAAKEKAKKIIEDRRERLRAKIALEDREAEDRRERLRAKIAQEDREAEGRRDKLRAKITLEEREAEARDAAIKSRIEQAAADLEASAKRKDRQKRRMLEERLTMELAAESRELRHKATKEKLDAHRDAIGVLSDFDVAKRAKVSCEDVFRYRIRYHIPNPR